MARTKETKMSPEQQEKMTQEMMASLQSSTYGKDYAQEHSSFFEEVENSDLEVVTENVAATTSNMEDELTNEVQSPPNPQKRISGKQRKATLEEYQQTFLQKPEAFGHADSHCIRATHSGILTSIHSTAAHATVSPRIQRSPTQSIAGLPKLRCQV